MHNLSAVMPELCSMIRILHREHPDLTFAPFFAAALAALAKSNKNYLIRSSPGSQFLFQIIALLVTLAIAIVGGAIIALIVRSAKHPGGKEFHVDHMYDDSGTSSLASSE